MTNETHSCQPHPNTRWGVDEQLHLRVMNAQMTCLAIGVGSLHYEYGSTIPSSLTHLVDEYRTVKAAVKRLGQMFGYLAYPNYEAPILIRDDPELWQLWTEGYEFAEEDHAVFYGGETRRVTPFSLLDQVSYGGWLTRL